MRVPISWLKEYVEFSETAAELAEKLSMAGFEVEEIDDLASNAKGVVVGKILSRTKHPNADKLGVCLVDVGSESPLQIVCGATNAKEGVNVPVALVGSELKAIGLKIKASELRGVHSEGMICSYAELGIQSNSDGIAILDELENKPLIKGQEVSKILGLDDVVLDIAITANRPDGMSVIGLAREVSALLKKDFVEDKNIEKVNNIDEFDDRQKNNFLDKSLQYSLISLSEIKQVRTPTLISDRLRKCGLTPVNIIVDIANYKMLERGQPLHMFDIDCIEEITGKKVNHSSFELNYAKDNEKFYGLDGKELILNSDVLVVLCNGLTVAIAGLIGSRDCAVSEDTTRVTIESAVYSASNIRNSSRTVGLRTESSSRFEKGLVNEISLETSLEAATLIKQYCNGKIEKTSEVITSNCDYGDVRLSKNSIDRVLGPLKSDCDESLLKVGDVKIDMALKGGENYLGENTIESILKSLHFTYRIEDVGKWIVEVPLLRRKDITREIDLIEEIARLVGYDQFDAKLPSPIQPGGLNSHQLAERTIRNAVCLVGLQEITTMSLVSKDDAAKDQITVRNPLLSEASSLRTNMWEEHLQVCERNLKASKSHCWIYEIGNIYKKSKENKYQEQALLTGLLTGNKNHESWSKNSKVADLDYFIARGKLETLFQHMKIDVTDNLLTKNEQLHPGKSAQLKLEGKNLGYFGQVHPELAEKHEIPRHTYIFKLDLRILIEACTRKKKLYPTFKEYAIVPFIERDISLVVNKSTLSSEIQDIIKKSTKDILENVKLIDRYEGNNLPKDKCSLAFRLRYRDKKKTLTEADVEPIHQTVREVLLSNFDIELRS